MLREIHSLTSVTRGHPGPEVVLARRASAAQKSGLRYERKVEMALSTLVRQRPGAKIEFQLPLHFKDANGPGTGILDFLLTIDDFVIVGETKLTWTPTAPEKLQKFYLPLVMCLLRSVRVRGLVVCRSLIPEAASTTPILSSLSALFHQPSPGSVLTLPWRGLHPMKW